MNPTEHRPESLDYRGIAERYNALPPGRAFRIARVYNITHFRRALERRGLAHRVDFKVAHQGNHCIIRRLSDVPMDTGEEG